MKFTDGAWLTREGYKIHPAKEVRFIRYEDEDKSGDGIKCGKVILTVPAYKIYGKGSTLGGVFLTVEISSPYGNVFRIRSYRHKGNRYLEQSYYELNIPSKPVYMNIKRTDDSVTVISGDSSVTVGLEDYSLTLKRGGKTITSSSGGGLAFIEAPEGVYMREQLSLSVGEHVYGMGERFGPFIKNGQSVDIINKDGGTFSEQSYKNVPFYLTDRDLGVFVNHSETVSFEVASENVSKTSFSVKGECLDYFLFAGSSAKDVLSLYTALSGRAPMLPEWSYGLWLSTSFITDYDEQTVLSFVDGMKDRGIDLKVFHFDCFWMKDSHWCNFLWDKDVFPDPVGLISKLHDRGLKVCVWINPYIAQESEIFDEGAANGFFLKDTDGGVWQTDLWQPGMAIVDFTNEDACRWYCSKLKALLDMGVDCFKTDFGERIPSCGVVWSDGKDPQRMHNFYSYLYNKTVFDLLVREKGEGEAVLFARSGTAGSQKFPVHWGGDCKSDYPSMEQTIRGGLSLMMSGFAFWSHDIGGFEDKSTPDVYKRWAAFGLMSSHSRLHGSSSYRVPWNYDEEAVEVVRYYTELKKKLMPYILEAASETEKSGIPVMRPMLLEFEDDPVCAFLDRQYMLGSKILAAPVFSEDGSVRYYLPAGKWKSVHRDDPDIIDLKYGRFIEDKCGYLEMPIFIKAD